MLSRRKQDEIWPGRVTIVTGASRGIGRAIAREVAAAGSAVALAARTVSDLQEVCGEIGDAGGEAMTVQTDMAMELDVIELVRTVVDRYGRLDAVVNNAGIGVFGGLTDTDTRDWDHVMAVNARGTYLLCREAVPHLRRRPVSHIVNIASVVGLTGYANQGIYSASKHAMMGLTKALARELQADGIRVHAVCPGGVDTEMATQARPDLDRSVLIQPADVARVVAMLLEMDGNAVIDQVQMRRATSVPFS